MKKLYFIYVDGTEFFYGQYPTYEIALKWAKKKPVLYRNGLFKIL